MVQPQSPADQCAKNHRAYGGLPQEQETPPVLAVIQGQEVKLVDSQYLGVQINKELSELAYEFLSYGQKHVLWGHSDLWPPNSDQFVVESEWTFVLNLKKCLHGVPERSRSREWDRQMYGSLQLTAVFIIIIFSINRLSLKSPNKVERVHHMILELEVMSSVCLSNHTLKREAAEWSTESVHRLLKQFSEERRQQAGGEGWWWWWWWLCVVTWLKVGGGGGPPGGGGGGGGMGILLLLQHTPDHPETHKHITWRFSAVVTIATKQEKLKRNVRHVDDSAPCLHWAVLQIQTVRLLDAVLTVLRLRASPQNRGGGATTKGAGGAEGGPWRRHSQSDRFILNSPLLFVLWQKHPSLQTAVRH